MSKIGKVFYTYSVLPQFEKHKPQLILKKITTGIPLDHGSDHENNDNNDSNNNILYFTLVYHSDPYYIIAELWRECYAPDTTL